MSEDTRIEIEALQSIYEDELTVEEVDGGFRVSMKVRPQDAADSCSLSIRVTIEIDAQYPELSKARVRLSEPRGLDDSAPRSLQVEIEKRLEELEGMPVLYDVFQTTSDFLVRAESSSSVVCPICLCALADFPQTVTPCEHYVHKSCLDRHIQYVRRSLGEKLAKTPEHMKGEVDKSLMCPVCRAVMEEDVDPIYPIEEDGKKNKGRRASRKNTSPVIDKGGYADFVFDWNSWRAQQATLKVIFDRQLANDGIIDVEKEAKKHLLTEDDVVLLNDLSIHGASASSSITATTVSSTSSEMKVNEGRETTKGTESRRGDGGRGRGRGGRGEGKVGGGGERRGRGGRGGEARGRGHDRTTGYGRGRGGGNRAGAVSGQVTEVTKATVSDKPVAQKSTHKAEDAVKLLPSGQIAIHVHAKPGAKMSAVTDVGEAEVGVALAAPPRDGQANEELIDFITTTLALRRSEVDFDKGAKSRTKTVLITSDRVDRDTVVLRLRDAIGK